MHYITFKQLREKLGGRSRSSIYRDVKCGRLPQPTKVGQNLYWREDEIDDALNSLRESRPF